MRVWGGEGWVGCGGVMLAWAWKAPVYYLRQQGLEVGRYDLWASRRGFLASRREGVLQL